MKTGLNEKSKSFRCNTYKKHRGYRTSTRQSPRNTTRDEATRPVRRDLVADDSRSGTPARPCTPVA
jgi:hypothetical protein